MVFLYGPILVMLIIIMVLSFLTAKRIYVDTKVNRSIWNTSESQTNVTNQAKWVFSLHSTSEIVRWIIDLYNYNNLFLQFCHVFSNVCDFRRCLDNWNNRILIFTRHKWQGNLYRLDSLLAGYTVVHCNNLENGSI